MTEYMFSGIVSVNCDKQFEIDGGKQIYLQEEKKCFKQEKLTFHRKVDKIGLTYNHGKQFYIESSEFTDVVRDLKDKTCINACLNGKQVLLPVEEFENMCMKLTVVLRSGPV
ncbi:hypothetical protein EB796_002517 [Bugula neritina]|uniref:Uncharacterized protein n=1 Tax=Bugula neritina TaxID=10212 RepID=A0A7J7KM00_BUGNE|nr:hypothetical protein EB796_002517 [Bugula neritina]